MNDFPADNLTMVFKASFHTMMIRNILRTTLSAAIATTCVHADVKLPAIISDHMVLNTSAKVPIWGKADPGEEVTVTLDGQTAKAVAGANGKWMTSLNLKDSSPGPFEMTVEGKNKILIPDVVIGQVWIASGQSNMAFTLENAIGAEQEITRFANPLIRQFLVKAKATANPLEDTEGKWIATDPTTAGRFSAIGYFFARKLQSELKIPVGLVNASWGGTPSESWTSPSAIDSVPELKASRERIWQLFKEFPGKMKAFVDGMAAWITETGREDRPVDNAAAYAGMNVSTEGWIPIELPGVVKAPGLPDAGAVWLRKEFDIPAGPPANLSLCVFVDGFESLYWNGDLIKQTTYQDYPGNGMPRYSGPYNLPADKVKQGRNVLAIRLYEPVGPAKFPAEPKANSLSLAGEWLAKAEYEFPAIEPGKIATAPLPTGSLTHPKNVAGYLFNGMINPILPYAISGVIWYQGEANTGRAFQYRTSFPLLIADWRNQWGQGDFPFYFCQLANFMPKKTEPGESEWAELREAQSEALKLPNTGQAVLIDIGESDDIHPRNKKDAGERLALLALSNGSGNPVSSSGPVYDSVKIEGGKAVIGFRNTPGGLMARPLPSSHDVCTKTSVSAPLVRNSPGSELEGFAICGDDRKWHWADAKILDGNHVVVWSDKVPSPVAVRYAWADNPTSNLYNAAGLPASPFRTDDFPPVTLNGKY